METTYDMDTNKSEIKDVKKQEKYVVCSLCGKQVSSRFYMNYNPDDKYVLCPNCRVKLMKNPSYTGVRNPSNNRSYLGILALLSVLILFFGIVKIAVNYSKQEFSPEANIAGCWTNSRERITIYGDEETGWTLETIYTLSGEKFECPLVKYIDGIYLDKKDVDRALKNNWDLHLNPHNLLDECDYWKIFEDGTLAQCIGKEILDVYEKADIR